MAVTEHKKWIQPLVGKYPREHMRIVSPSVTNGVRCPQSTVMGIEWLKQFLNQCTGCTIDFCWPPLVWSPLTLKFFVATVNGAAFRSALACLADD